MNNVISSFTIDSCNETAISLGKLLHANEGIYFMGGSCTFDTVVFEITGGNTIGFTNVNFESPNGGEAYRLYGGPLYKIVFTECDFFIPYVSGSMVIQPRTDYVPGYGIDGDQGSTMVDNIWFIDCLIARFGDWGVKVLPALDPSGDYQYCQNISFMQTRFAENGAIGGGGDIWLEDAKNVSFIGVTFASGPHTGVIQANIAEYGDCSGIKIVGCAFMNTGAEIDPLILGANIFSANDGFVTESSGTAYLNATSTATFNHSMSITPSFVLLSFNSTAFTSYTWSATSTEITVTVETSGTYVVMWYARY
jgi:hypothetical protein